MRLSNRIAVQLVQPDGGRSGLPDILVALDTFVAGRYYFGTLVGLTDTAGMVMIEGEELARDFRRNQQLFPMGYPRDGNAVLTHSSAWRPAGAPVAAEYVG
jgi:hypothetical protein